jgi:hypothetical protein
METHKHIEAYQELFDHMINEHGLTLLQSELDEIIRLSQKTVERYNEASDGSPFVSTESKCNKHGVIKSDCEHDYEKITKYGYKCKKCGETGFSPIHG